MTAPLLRVEQLRKQFAGQPAVNGLSLEIRPGECLGLLGPNGAGKTTSLRMILGHLAADSGRIELMGHTLPEGARAARGKVGVVGQFDTLDPDFTCTENLRVYGRYFGIDRALLEERIPRLLAFAELTNKADAKIGELSGGMKRRLSLARALVNDPQLLLLDEPTTGLDPQARHLMWDRLGQLLREGRAILLTTHFMEEAQRLCSRILLIDHGRPVLEGETRALIADEIEPEVFEVSGVDPAVVAANPAVLAAASRTEISGETFFAYTHRAEDLARALDAVPSARVLHRPANLEDVFLKTTGRQIRQDA